MSYFKLSSETLEKWTSTRKGQQKIGSNFIHPGIYSTKNFQADTLWFLLAFFIEILTLLVALFLTGFNPFIIVGAVLAVVLDGVFAIKLHAGEKNINKYRCKQEINSYEEKIQIIDNPHYRRDTETFNRAINAWEKKRTPFIALLFLIAILKVVFTFAALLPYGILAYLVPALFFLAAYIHIKHTGFWNAHRLFKNAAKDEEAKFHYENASNQSKASQYYISSSTPYPFQNIPKELKNELDLRVKDILNLGVDEIDKLRIDESNQINSKSKDLIIVGKSSDHKILYNESSKEFRFSFWGNIKDNELFEMINETGLSDDLKSFLCYIGLKAQNFSEPEMPR